MAPSLAASLTSLTLPDYEPERYGGENLGFGIARGLFALKFPGLFMSHRSSTTLEAEALVIFAATAHAVH